MFKRRDLGGRIKDVCRIKTIPKTKNLQVFFRLAGFVDCVFLIIFFIISDVETSGYRLLENLKNIISEGKNH